MSRWLRARRGGEGGRHRLPRVVVVGLFAAGIVAAAGATWLVLSGSDDTPVDELAAGDCVQNPEEYANDPGGFWRSDEIMPSGMEVVPCDESHASEVFFAADLWDDEAPYPGDEAVTKTAVTKCEKAYEEYVGVPVDYGWWHPRAESWDDGDRSAGCVAFDPGDRLLDKSVRKAAGGDVAAKVLNRLAPGDCVQTPEAYADDPKAFWTGPGEMPAGFAVAPCDQPHAGEVFFAHDLWDDAAEYPGPKALTKAAEKRCDRTIGSYVGTGTQGSSLAYTWWTPDEETWADGDRRAGCIALHPDGKMLEAGITR